VEPCRKAADAGCDSARVARLRVLMLGASGHCNLRCRMCSIWREPPSLLSADVLRAVIDDQRVREETEYLGVTGGEPLLHQKLGGMVAEIARSCDSLREVTLTTNGSFPDRLRDFGTSVAEVCDAGRTRLITNVSLDGVGLVHDTQRGVAGSFGLAVRSIDVAKELASEHANVGVTLSAVVTRLTSDNVLELLHLARSFEVPLVLSLPMQTNAYFRTDRLPDDWMLLPEQRQRLTALLGRLLGATVASRGEDALSRTHIEHLLSFMEGRPRRARCVFREREGCLVMATGDVFLCGGGEAFRLGHVGDAPPSVLLERGRSTGRVRQTEPICSRCPSVCYLHAVAGE